MSELRRARRSCVAAKKTREGRILTDEKTSFAEDFRRLTGSPSPFRWQERLFARHFRCDDIPCALDIPTGLGKTSVMAIWYLARKAGAAGASLPRRLVYVVDRRAVVDQATEEVERVGL